MNQIKLKRIVSQIVKEVSDILNNEARDRLMHTITITGCDVSSDLSYAKIYFTCMLDIDKKEIEHDIRHTPKLVFKFDESVEYGNHIDKILDEIHGENNE